MSNYNKNFSLFKVTKDNIHCENYRNSYKQKLNSKIINI